MTSDLQWQDIGWNGLQFQVPADWQPSVILPDYLFFEHAGTPVLEIKWQYVQGNISLSKAFRQLAKQMPEQTQLVKKEPPLDLHKRTSMYEIAGFQVKREANRNDGLLIFDPTRKRSILVQWFLDTPQHTEIIKDIILSLHDTSGNRDQLWAMYDIQALLPAEAVLQSHEFLPGKYTLSFQCGMTSLSLYRFKPAAVILKAKSLGSLGRELLDFSPCEESTSWAAWNHHVTGIALLLAKLRRKPVWYWMRCWHDAQNNAILGVKAVGTSMAQTQWLEKICKNYHSVDAG